MQNITEKSKYRVKIGFERDVFPWIGAKPVNEVKALDLIGIARRIENRGVRETTHRIIGYCGKVFLYAIATGRAEADPTPAVKQSLRPLEEKHMAATTDPVEVGRILQMIAGCNGSLVVRSALQVAPLLFVRPGELRHAEWKDIDFDAAEWRYIASKTKQSHVVPLCRQAIEILKELHPATGGGKFVFPSPTSSNSSRCFS